MTLLIPLLFACSSSSELTPKSAAALADQITASPSTADTILSDDTDSATFEAYLSTGSPQTRRSPSSTCTRK